MASFQYGFEDLEINDAIIMSFLEESPLDDDDHISEDEEQLNRVMRSLEAEINTGSVELIRTCCPQDSPNMEELEEELLSCGKQVDGYDGFLAETRDLDFGLTDLDDMMSWYSVSYMDGTDNVRETGGFDGYSYMNYEVVAMEEQQFCYPLWQENNDVAM